MSEDYQRTARALARETEMNPASKARIEQTLLRAMALPPSAFARSAPADRRSLGGGWSGGRVWIPAAAAILLIAGALFVWRMNRTLPIGETRVMSAVSKPTAPVTRMTDKATDQTPDVTVTAATARSARPIRKTTRRATATVVNPAGFVELPWTVGLPAFESGEIVRMEVPVASLPAYGIDISAGANRPVEADILIGQDGFARAIRLVANSARSVQ